MRISEALALRANDIDTEIGSVTALHGTGDRRRTVGIDPGANESIEALKERRWGRGISDPAPLFCTSLGEALHQADVRRMLHRLPASAGLDKRVHPHGLRHTDAYELMMEDIAMPIINRQLGHRSLTTTDALAKPKDGLARRHSTASCSSQLLVCVQGTGEVPSTILFEEGVVGRAWCRLPI